MGTSLRVLLVEDSDDDEQLIKRTLHRGDFTLSKFLRVQTRKALSDALANHTWDVIISDFRLPGFDGLAALNIVKKTGLDIPFIVVSGAVGEEVVVDTMKAGAHDYVMKGNLTRLVPAIQRELQEVNGRRARRLAEEDVRKLSRVVEQSPGLVIITDTDGKIEYVNPQYEYSTGYSAKEVLGKHPSITRSGLTSTSVYEELWDRLDRGLTWRGELSHKSKQGNIFYTQATMTPIRDANDNVTHYVSIQEDITERKQAEKAILQGEQRFRQLVEHAADGIFVHDYDGRIQNVNQQACDSLGYTRAELMQKRVTDFVVDSNLASLQSFWDTVTVGKPQTINGHHRRKDGSVVAVEVSVGLFETDGEFTYLALARDVSEREKLEKARQELNAELERQVRERTLELSQTTRQLEVILDNSADAIALVNLDGTFAVTNPAFQRLFEEQTPSCIADILTNLQISVGAQLVAALEQARNEGVDARIEIVVPTKAGINKDIDVTITPINNADGRFTALVMSMRDITHLKEIDRLKSRFVSNAAHDLASPIANLRMHLYSLKDAPEKLPEYIAALENQTLRLDRLVNDLRTLAHLDQGQATFDMVPVDLHMLIDEVLMTHLPMAKHKKLNLDFAPCEQQPIIMADFNQFERVIVNLLNNALNYTPAGGDVIISTEIHNADVRIHVSDTGIGVAQEAQRRIFDRFYRTIEAKNSEIDGTGLGLAIVKEIVDVHKGSIELKSALHKGSTFTISLPLLQE